MRDKKEIAEFLKYDRSLKYAYHILKGHCPKFKFEIRKHPIVVAESITKKVIGYYPSGEWQVIITKGKKKWSLIKGMCSFGDFEIMRTTPKEKDVHRFKLLKELIEYINGR